MNYFFCGKLKTEQFGMFANHIFVDVLFYILVPKNITKFRKSLLKNSAISNSLVSKSINKFSEAVTVEKLYCFLPMFLSLNYCNYSVFSQ